MTKKPPMLTGSTHKGATAPRSSFITRVRTPNAFLDEFSDRLDGLMNVLIEHGRKPQLTLVVDWTTITALGFGPEGGSVITPGGVVRIQTQQHKEPHHFRQDLSRRFNGPPSETCELCGCDPRNSIHKKPDGSPL